MATYCYRCPECGTKSIAVDRDARVCGPCMMAEGDSKTVYLLRDYKAENAGIAVAVLRAEREHSKEEYAAKFLPTNKDLASPTDPDGTKGMREWRENHEPDSSNKKPMWPGKVERTTF